ncbi:MAG: hypothetical protein M1834_004978 [Cirrosporium novae-zelandiae]|nr:MAG: hypothetical protein M1834_004978 [Cirrosporium novae-zelandiae]
MKFSLSLLLAAASLVPSTVGHYCFNRLIVDGDITSEYEYVRKNNNSNSPVTDVTSTDLRCNSGGLSTGNVTSTYKVKAGSTLGFALDTGIGHPGPVQIYMSKATNGDASAYDGSADNWFKIYSLGVEEVTSDGLQWATNEIQNFTFTLPAKTPAGQYLLRAESIALHGASTFEGAQYYISCAQIEVEEEDAGSGTPHPKVSIPGLYTGYEPGILINIYWPTPTNYTMPGPSLWPNPSSTTANATKAVVLAATASSSAAARARRAIGFFA